MDWDILRQLTLDFLGLSLLAVGGAVSTLSEMHRIVVDQHGWLTSREFAELVALGQAAPGPNVVIVALIGWKVAGFSGAAVSMLAMCVPAAALVLTVEGAWQRFRHARWRINIEAGLAPVTVGLMMAAGYLVTLAANETIAAYVLSGMVVIAMLATRIHPLWLIAVGAVAGFAGLI